jgi:sigma54-dependent transcription regulator
MTDGQKRVNKVCMAIQQLDDADIQEVLKMAKEQREYIHPLKSGTAGRINMAGNRNIKIVNKIISLKKLLNTKP